MKNIYQTINAIMEEIEPIGKDSVNKQQGFKYRGIDAVMNALQPLFAKHKLFCLPEVIESKREERASKSGGVLIYSILKTKYTFYAEDGSSVYAVVEGEGMDSADKSTNKALAIAFKYACFQLFCIPTEETSPDPDKETHALQPNNNVKYAVVCDKCGCEITDTKRIKDGNEYVVPANEVKEKCGGLCMKCWLAANPPKTNETNKPIETREV